MPQPNATYRVFTTGHPPLLSTVMSVANIPSSKWRRVGIFGGALVILGMPLWHAAARSGARSSLGKEAQAVRDAGIKVKPIRRICPVEDQLAGQLAITPSHRAELYGYFLRGDDVGRSRLPDVIDILLEENRKTLDDLAKDPLPWLWQQPSTDCEEARRLIHYQDLAALYAARAVKTGNWSAIIQSLRVRRFLAKATSLRSLSALQDMSRPPLETLASWLAAGRRAPDAAAASLGIELAFSGPTLSSVMRQELGRLLGDIDNLLQDRTGRLAEDYQLQGGVSAGLWLRQALAGPALVEGIPLHRDALLALKNRRSAARLMALVPIEQRWSAWLRKARTQFLYRITPLAIMRRQVALKRTQQATQAALWLTHHARTLPGMLEDPLTGESFQLERLGDSAVLKLPKAPFPYPDRTRWRLTPAKR